MQLAAPGAALFFATYDGMKHYLSKSHPTLPLPVSHMAAATIGEVVSCNFLIKCLLPNIVYIFNYAACSYRSMQDGLFSPCAN